VSKLLKTGLAVGGAVAAAGALRKAFRPRPRYAPWEKPPYREFPKKVLILGDGFGGYTAAQTLCDLVKDRDDVGVMVISRENFFTFWPMVPGVIGSNVDIGNIAQPLRRPLIRAGASFRRAELKGIDFEGSCVHADDREFPFDHLVLALGGQPNFFGIPGVEEYSLTMRGLGDALRIRDRVIERFEEATLARGQVPESKLTFVVIGGRHGDRGRLGDPRPCPRGPRPGLPEHRREPGPGRRTGGRRRYLARAGPRLEAGGPDRAPGPAHRG
jgi:NADH dehydrogenase